MIKLFLDGNRTYQKPANEIVVHIILEELLPSIILTTPGPDIISVAVVLGTVENAGTSGPHDDAKGEKGNGEDSVVYRDLLGPSVTTSHISADYNDGEQERDAGDDQERNLRPDDRLDRPSW